MTPEESTLILRLAELKRAAPEKFEAVEKAMTAYAAVKLNECMLAAPDQVFRAQGRAQNSDELAKRFGSCVQEADKISAKQKTQPLNR